jgi:hypothetical protein
MKRKIKFRAWDGEEMYIPVITEGGKAAVLWYGYEMHGETKDPIMQYTGLKDKKGKEIYEGDIVRCADGVVDMTTRVQWDFNSLSQLENQRHLWEIIGNIYENADLIK